MDEGLLQLAADIHIFLGLYAHKPAHRADDPDGPYTGPDPSCMEAWANQITAGIIPDRAPFSEWGSGCYRPIHSKEGRAEHDRIISEISAYLRNGRKPCSELFGRSPIESVLPRLMREVK